MRIQPNRVLQPLLLWGTAACFAAVAPLAPAAVKDRLTPLPANAIRFHGGLENDLQNSLIHWNRGTVPYAEFVQFFRTGRKQFALGEMWGKAVRSGAMFYRYNQDPELKAILKKTVGDLLTTKRSNGSISCSEPSAQPDSRGGDLWERKYVLLGLDEYYEQVEKDPAVLQAMMDEADCTINQIGPPPKVRIVDQGWSRNHIESSSILEPILRLYKLTGRQRYLDFARYIVELEGGAKDNNIIEEAFNNKDPEQIGGPYPKAYEMTSVFEGVLEYYRVTGNERWKQATLNFFRNVRDKEITLIGNGGGDIHHHEVKGETWDYTALEQSNPKMDRTMETCTGVTWLKLCSQVNRLTADPSAVDAIERYAYNGLIGAIKPEGDGFSYVNRLNGSKSTPVGWGWTFGNLRVTCCNLNGPMGLAYLPFVAVLNSKTGPVINLYNAATATAATPTGQPVQLEIKTDYPLTGAIAVTVTIPKPERFSIELRIPAWSGSTTLSVNGSAVKATPGTYVSLDRTWSTGDAIDLNLDMRCRLIDAPHGSNRDGDNFKALVRGPIVLARDENIDPDYDKPVTILAKEGYVEVSPIAKTLPSTRQQFRVPTSEGFIPMVDYASVNNWNGKHIRTWLPMTGIPVKQAKPNGSTSVSPQVSPKPCPELANPLAQKALALRKSSKIPSLTEFLEMWNKPTPSPVKLLPVTARTLSCPDLARRAASAHVKVGWVFQCTKCSKWHAILAGGYAIASDTVVTAFHVLKQNEAMKPGTGIPVVVRGEDEILPITGVLAADASMDAAVIRVASNDLTALPLANTVEVGDSVYCFSRPFDQFDFFSSGMVNGFTTTAGSKDKPAGRRILVSTAWNAGSSGSAILDACGNVVGHVSELWTLSDTRSDGKSMEGLTVHVATPAAEVRKQLATCHLPAVLP